MRLFSLAVATKVARALALVSALGTPMIGKSVDGTFSRAQALASGPRRTSWEGLAIVVNRKNPIGNVTLGQLRQILFAETKWWPNGRPVALVAMERGSAERKTVLRVVYHMSDRDLDTYFLFEAFRGELSTSPTILKSAQDVRKFVLSTPGAVGYLRASDVDNSVKVVRVNGFLPEDDGYPLRLRARPVK